MVLALSVNLLKARLNGFLKAVHVDPKSQVSRMHAPSSSRSCALHEGIYAIDGISKDPCRSHMFPCQSRQTRYRYN